MELTTKWIEFISVRTNSMYWEQLDSLWLMYSNLLHFVILVKQ